MENTKQVHAVIPVSVARAAGYPQPWLLVMHDKLRVDDVVAVIAYDDRETLLTTPLQEGHVIVHDAHYAIVLSSIAIAQEAGEVEGAVPVSKWWPGQTIHDDIETILVGA